MDCMDRGIGFAYAYLTESPAVNLRNVKILSAHRAEDRHGSHAPRERVADPHVDGGAAARGEIIGEKPK